VLGLQTDASAKEFLDRFPLPLIFRYLYPHISDYFEFCYAKILSDTFSDCCSLVKFHCKNTVITQFAVAYQ